MNNLNGFIANEEAKVLATVQTIGFNTNVNYARNTVGVVDDTETDIEIARLEGLYEEHQKSLEEPQVVNTTYDDTAPVSKSFAEAAQPIEPVRVVTLSPLEIASDMIIELRTRANVVNNTDSSYREVTELRNYLEYLVDKDITKFHTTDKEELFSKILTKDLVVAMNDISTRSVLESYEITPTQIDSFVIEMGKEHNRKRRDLTTDTHLIHLSEESFKEDFMDMEAAAEEAITLYPFYTHLPIKEVHDFLLNF